MGKKSLGILFFIMPSVIIMSYFFLYPLLFLFFSGTHGSDTWYGNYIKLIIDPRFRGGMVNSLLLSIIVTIATLIMSTMLGFFLERNNFKGKKIVLALITFPLSFPGVVVAFMVIILFGNMGFFGKLTNIIIGKKISFAYTLGGLFVAYLYFSIPRVTMTLVASISKLNRQLEEAARSLGGTSFSIAKDIIIPALTPSIVAGGALCFATSMGAFGTAFTIAHRIDILPILIYTEFTLEFNIFMASAMAFTLGLITLSMLYVYRLLIEK